MFHFDEMLAQFHHYRAATSVNGVSILHPALASAIDVVLEVSELNGLVIYAGICKVG